jgi:hypothetical protein
MFLGTMCPSSGETSVFMRHLVLVILCGWLSGMQGGMTHSTLHTRQSSTQNNKYQVSHKHSCFSWWWAHSSPKHVEIDKYTNNKLHTKLALFTRSYKDARSAKQNLAFADMYPTDTFVIRGEHFVNHCSREYGWPERKSAKEKQINLEKGNIYMWEIKASQTQLSIIICVTNYMHLMYYHIHILKTHVKMLMT